MIKKNIVGTEGLDKYISVEVIQRTTGNVQRIIKDACLRKRQRALILFHRYCACKPKRAASSNIKKYVCIVRPIRGTKV